ncbi:trypsin-like peptidase domain-containing protein [Planktothrix sp. FACHB-1355]|uniref:Trypsin-like peptidase domain-containing protein n=1 Tax=Aerosakkonema funiforme FACHB-1375 TaxID=2949571 RepID=A0A926ZK63_9CYAN|nr:MULTISPECIES: HhoA/HhoB/HtrA family serine endopeptidase [Oscillatoriales]MBD2183711.1 trypsin-like peptidase domain-containing protein [Aerosakkonema funiforme FACHB-1375]MBD3559523.1 trypsin-like peptidase domain-containing protein [Planktothrix sp. FACHB-1355]
MQSEKIYHLLGKIARYGLATFLGAVLISGAIAVLPSQASPKASINSALPPEQSIGLKVPQTKQSNSFVTAAVNRVGPAVVRIDTERTVSRRLDPFFDDPFFRRFFGEDFTAQPRQELLRGQGSGFIIDKGGIILTNAHVVNQADKVMVRLKDGRSLEGQVRGVDEITDLAVVKIDARDRDLPVASLGDSSQVQVGDWAIAVGNPLGLDNTVTLGIVSTLHRSSTEVGVPDKRLDFIQTDAAINPGNSGGPLLNEYGEVIGINTAIRADAMGIGFAIPINKAKEISVVLARGQKVPHPYIGVQMITLTPELAKQNNDDPNTPFTIPEVKGVLVMKVLPNTPAARGGLRKGDAIVEIDGTPVTSAETLQNIVESSRVGQVLNLVVRRGSETLQLSVRTGELQS